MIISIAQTRSITGDIEENIKRHLKIVRISIANNSDVIVFPELSLTGYEPTLASRLACSPNDGRFDNFQTTSDMNSITIGVGIPAKEHPRPTITMVLFRPNLHKQIYSKRYIHPDEEPYFVNGDIHNNHLEDHPEIALAICFELAVPQHAQAAFNKGASIYLASVAKTGVGVTAAHTRLSEIAKTFSMVVIMANCVGMADGERCGGRSAVWNNQGVQLAQLDESNEGLLIYDSNSGEVTTHVIS